MDFWNEYEGKTIAESFPLEKLLYPEGRNGFFSTFNGTGTPAVIRLTESLNDQEEMFEQWKTVAGLNHPHLITIRKFGATTVDEVPLLYAVMEPSDAGLAEVLRERSMTAAEVTEIASAVIPALQSLHAAGLVHGHIDPFSILAVGETIKLRSDCAYRVVDPDELLKRQSRDLKDLAVLLLQSLTRQSRATIEDAAVLPPSTGPLNEIIRHGLSGSWGLEEMAAALRPGTPARNRPAPVAAAQPPAATSPPSKEAPRPAEATPKQQAASPLAQEEFRRAAFTGVNPLFAAGFLLFLSVMAVYFFHLFRIDRATALTQAATAEAVSPASGPASAHPMANAVAGPAPSPSTSARPSPEGLPVAPRPEQPSVDRPASPEVTLTHASSGHGSWRVVVFTYNKEGQAQQKANSIERKHRSLKAGVFTPTGHAPYLVVLGEGMSRDEASALKRKAHSEGLPRDTYIQNYEAR